MLLGKSIARKEKEKEKEKERKKEKEKIFILDWDDTLFPTFLISRITILKDEDLKKLMILDKVIVSLLSKIMSTNLTRKIRAPYLFIVTNSKQDWIRKSSFQFLPLTHRFIKKYNTPAHKFCVISARASFENKFPKDPIAWKVCAFQQILEKISPEKISPSVKNIRERERERDDVEIISCGDGDPERIALFKTKQNNSGENGLKKNIKVKSIKFIESPQSIDDIILQLEFISKHLESILKEEEEIDFFLDEIIE
jgi:hypothetical protein